MVLNVSAILDRIRAAEREALDEVADSVATEARRRAPVRKVFKERPGFQRRFRQLTGRERSVAIRRALAYPYRQEWKRRRAIRHLKTNARAELRRKGSANNLRQSGSLRILGVLEGRRFTPSNDAARVGRGFSSPSLEPLLTSRGRYELSSGRGVTNVGGQVQLGGRLKNSIESEGVTESDKGLEARITAAVRYAKFVEFPTVHNAAQPFLLPALQDHRSKLRQAVAQNIKRALGG